MRAVSFPCDDLEPFDCFRVTHNIIKDLRSVFLNPMEYEHDKPIRKDERIHQGSSYGTSEPLGAFFVFEPEENIEKETRLCHA